MTTETCHQCKKPLPEGQSFYEDHNVKVCLACFRTSKRCMSCRFPSNSLTYVPGYGDVCEFCKDTFKVDDGMSCYICQDQIWKGASHYADHGKEVCQKCFAEARIRCFSCRFPQTIGSVAGLGGICEFCQEENINKGTDIKPFLKSLTPFLKSHKHKLPDKIDIHWVDWRLIMGMQLDSSENREIKFFDEMIRYCNPVFYMKDRFYIIPSINQQWFISYLAGQLVAADLCKKYGLSHLMDDAPFQEMARGWCHWISYNTTRILKYKKLTKFFSRYPDSNLTGTFSKFLAMSEFRKNKEIIEFAHQNLKLYAKKYL